MIEAADRKELLKSTLTAAFILIAGLIVPLLAETEAKPDKHLTNLPQELLILR